MTHSRKIPHTPHFDTRLTLKLVEELAKDRGFTVDRKYVYNGNGNVPAKITVTICDPSLTGNNNKVTADFQFCAKAEKYLTKTDAARDLYDFFQPGGSRARQLDHLEKRPDPALFITAALLATKRNAPLAHSEPQRNSKSALIVFIRRHFRPHQPTR